MLEVYLHDVGGPKFRAALLSTGLLPTGVESYPFWTELFPKAVSIIIQQLYLYQCISLLTYNVCMYCNVCIYVHMYVCMFVYVSIYMYTCVVCIVMYMYVCIYMYVYEYVYVCMSVE